MRQVVIVGGGVIGCCCAYYLALEGGSDIEITIVERNVVAGAASGKAGGFLASEWCSHSDPLDKLARSSYKLHAELAETLNGAENYEYRKLDTYSVDLDLSQDHSIKVPSQTLPDDSPVTPNGREWLNGPSIDPLNKNQFKTLGNQTNTAQVHPEKFTRHLLEVTKTLCSISVLEHTTVTGLKISNDNQVEGIQLEGEKSICADDVLLCVGPWTRIACDWIQKIDPKLSDILRKQIVPEKYYSIIISPNSEEAQSKIAATALFLKNSSPVAKLSEPEVYPRPTGKVYVCGCEEVLPIPDDPSEVLPTIEEHCKTLASIAASVSNLLRVGEYYDDCATAHLETKQACYLPISWSGVPIIGPISSVKGLWIATGHGCWGILNSPATGKIMADFLLHGKPCFDCSAFAPESLLTK